MRHIRIISPSGAIDPSLIDGAALRLLSWGYRVSVAPHARGCVGRFAAEDSGRLADFNNALADPGIDIILCSRGGYGLQRIIQDIRIPAGNAPLLVGFSDITAAHALFGKSGRPSLHASMCKALATLPDDLPAMQALRRALEGCPMRYSLPPHPFQRNGDCKGRLIGGNLSVLYGLQGTFISLRELIASCPEPPVLFLEDIGERHYHIDRMMRNLDLSGIFRHIGGLVVGQFTDCPDDPGMGGSVLQTLAEVVRPYSFPVLFNFPAGHIDGNMPLRLHTPWHLSVTPDQNIFEELR